MIAILSKSALQYSSQVLGKTTCQPSSAGESENQRKFDQSSLSSALTGLRIGLLFFAAAMLAGCATSPGAPTPAESAVDVPARPNTPVELRGGEMTAGTAESDTGTDGTAEQEISEMDRGLPTEDEESSQEKVSMSRQASGSGPATAMPESNPVENSHRLLTGSVTLAGARRVEFSPDEVAEAVAYFVPEGHFAAPQPRHDYIIHTRHKRFTPSVLPIEQGSTVAFPNADPILHNAFSVSPAGRFDVGLYGQGESKSITFDQPGLVFVHCNVHHAMRAEILVMNTPWFTRVEADGTFALGDIPTQSGTLFVWHPRSKPVSVSIPSGVEDLRQTLDMLVSSPRVPKHSNKFGKPYRPER